MDIRERIKQGFVFYDGGMGTLLQKAGLQPGEIPEKWNLTRPDIITGINYDYIMAGSNIINTNTFGANRFKFPDSEGEFTLEKVIRAAVDCTKEAKRRSGKEDVYISLDIGPTGKLLEPLGDLEFEDAVAVFAEVVKIGASCGVDMITIETMNDSYEAKAAVLAAKENSSLPVFLTTVFDAAGKLLTGANPAAVVAMAEGLKVDAAGLNCSLGPEEMKVMVEQLVKYASVPVIVNPNAGLPAVENGETTYPVGPEEFAASMRDIALMGARVLGGCCGTTPEHIRLLTEAVKDVEPVPLTEKDISMVSSYTHAVFIGGGNPPALIGERINPTGKKRLKQALRENDFNYILEQGLSEEEQGADILDVNVGLPEIDEPGMMAAVVKQLQGVLNLPLQIDTTNVEAMERALRLYNGKPMVNSVNGKEEVMEQIFPLVQKYGGLVVALTLDEGGIPNTVEGRLAIADKIYKRAAEYGIKKKDIIIDPLAMSISTDGMAARVTLDTVKGVRDRFHGITSLGVSNVSFGLPNRDIVNTAYFTMAMENGLSAAIMNPNSMEMKKAYYSFCALNNMDAQCVKYIGFATETLPKYEEKQTQAFRPEVSKTADVQESQPTGSGDAEGEGLTYAIRKGLKEQAAQQTKELLKTKEPLYLINEILVPALDVVGKGFEAKTVFLPQLLMSAEAAKTAFEEIKVHILKNGGESEKKCSFVIATVKGDIHDIGKNIVKVLLDNYGFEVYDLGKDVPPEAVVKAVVEHHSPLCGLSALMTTTVPAMEETIRQLRVKAPWCRVCVGGAVLTQEYADMIGADKYCRDAMETVRYAEEINDAV